MEITNKKNLSQCWVDAVKNDTYDKVGHFSTTTLIGPPRLHFLKETFDDKLSEDVAEKIWALFGSAIHHVLDRAGGEDEYSEKRIIMPFLEREISLKPDRVEKASRPNHYTLKDFKVTSVWVWAKPVKYTWVAQTNLYAFALEEVHGIIIDDISIELLLRDWSRGDYLKQKSLSYPDHSTGAHDRSGYPDSQVQVMPVEKWSKKRCEAYLTERVSLFKSCEGLAPDDLPFCNDQERWSEPGKFVVKSVKPDGTLSDKATRGGANFETKADAEEFIKKIKAKPTKTRKKAPTRYQIEYRPARSRRCEYYCPVAEHCNQYQTEVNPAF